LPRADVNLTQKEEKKARDPRDPINEKGKGKTDANIDWGKEGGSKSDIAIKLGQLKVEINNPTFARGSSHIADSYPHLKRGNSEN